MSTGCHGFKTECSAITALINAIALGDAADWIVQSYTQKTLLSDEKPIDFDWV